MKIPYTPQPTIKEYHLDENDSKGILKARHTLGKETCQKINQYLSGKNETILAVIDYENRRIVLIYLRDTVSEVLTKNTTIYQLRSIVNISSIIDADMVLLIRWGIQQFNNTFYTCFPGPNDNMLCQVLGLQHEIDTKEYSVWSNILRKPRAIPPEHQEM